MSCETCDGDGYIKQETLAEQMDSVSHLDEAPGAGYSPCPDCETECSICEDTGFREIADELQRDALSVNTSKFCPACWVWDTCDDCFGEGVYEDGYFDPNVGHTVGGVFDCENCDGIGYVLVEWVGEGDSPEVYELTGWGHMFGQQEY